LPLKGAQGGLAIANGIFRGDFNFRGQTFPMIPEPSFGFGFGIHKACGVSCLSATVDKAVEKFKLFIHIIRVMEASGAMWRGSSFFDNISISKDNEAPTTKPTQLSKDRERIPKGMRIITVYYLTGIYHSISGKYKRTGITISGSIRVSQQGY
jgi:hypothetical protein